jgi:carbonic anhydrase
VSGVSNEQVGDFLRFVPSFGKKSSVRVNPKVFLPSRHRYFEYRGSYSRPPCSEGVKWVLLIDPTQYSMRQIEQLSSGVMDLVRDVQPRNQRRVLTNQR